MWPWLLIGFTLGAIWVAVVSVSVGAWFYERGKRDVDRLEILSREGNAYLDALSSAGREGVDPKTVAEFRRWYREEQHR